MVDGKDAARPEDLWNILLPEHGCSLYCVYRIDLFAHSTHAAELHPIVCIHDHASGAPVPSSRAAARAPGFAKRSRSDVDPPADTETRGVPPM
jgi:hypothetical protein